MRLFPLGWVNKLTTTGLHSGGRWQHRIEIFVIPSVKSSVSSRGQSLQAGFDP